MGHEHLLETDSLTVMLKSICKRLALHPLLFIKAWRGLDAFLLTPSSEDRHGFLGQVVASPLCSYSGSEQKWTNLQAEAMLQRITSTITTHHSAQLIPPTPPSG